MLIKCKKCEYEWESRKALPKQCPKCKRYDYNAEKKPVEQIAEQITNTTESEK